MLTYKPSFEDKYRVSEVEGKPFLDYVKNSFEAVSIDKNSILPSSIVQYFLNGYGRDAVGYLMDHQFVIKRPVGISNITVSNPYIGNIVKNKHGSGVSLEKSLKLKALKEIVVYVNDYFEKEYNPTHVRKFEFIIVNQSFYGHATSDDIIMCLFPQKDQLDDNAFIEKHRLRMDSTVAWLEDMNTISTFIPL